MKKSVLILLTLFCVMTLSAQSLHRMSSKEKTTAVKIVSGAVISATSFSVAPPTIYTDEDAFIQALGISSCLEDFNDDIFAPSEFLEPDTTITSDPFSYTIGTVLEGETLFAGFKCMSHEFLEDTLLVTNNKRHINAFGGYFFATDYDDARFIASPVTIYVGDYTYTLTSQDSTTFIGFIFQDTIPYIKFKGTEEDYSYATIDHFYVGDNLNFKPEILSTEAVTTDEDTPFSLSLSGVAFKDVDGDTQFSLSVIAGENYTFSGTTVTPALNFNGTLQVGVTVSDGIEASDTEFISVTVNPVNDPPVITSTAPADGKENTLYTYTVAASDPDNTSLIYTLSNKPAGMEINNNIITWTPAAGVTTSGEVTLTVSDGSLSDTEKFTIAVTPLTDIDTNRAEPISLRPNPASAYVTVVSPARILTVNIIDVTGKIVLTKNTDSNSLTIDEISGIPRGIYFVRVKTVKETKVLKLIKQ